MVCPTTSILQWIWEELLILSLFIFLLVMRSGVTVTTSKLLKCPATNQNSVYAVLKIKALKLILLEFRRWSRKVKLNVSWIWDSLFLTIRNVSYLKRIPLWLRKSSWKSVTSWLMAFFLTICLKFRWYEWLSAIRWLDFLYLLIWLLLTLLTFIAYSHSVL